MVDERIDLKQLAARASVNRSYLSKVINSKDEKSIGPAVARKLANAFPTYFQIDNKNNTGAIEGVLRVMAEAFKAQAVALSDQAEAFRTQAAILRSIESKMAIVDVQATMKTSLEDVQEKMTTVWERQELAIEEFRERFARLEALKSAPTGRARKTADHNGGNA